MRIDRELGRKRVTLPMRMLAAAVWLCVWQAGAMLLHSDILLASPWKVLRVLGELLTTADLYRAVGTSFARIAAGFGLALVCGFVLGSLSYVFTPVRALTEPLLTTLKSVPVASFVILALVWVKARYLSVFISFLMALPIFCSHVRMGLESVDYALLEMADVFKVGIKKRALHLYLPALKKPIREACRLSCGMCWKAGIAAEVIGIPQGSIGEKLYDAKLYLNTAEVLAWTVVIVVISLICERLLPGGEGK